MKSNSIVQPCDFGADFKLLFEAVPGKLIILLPDAPKFTVFAASNAYLNAVNQSREDMVGKGLFETFPEGPQPSHVTTVQKLRASFDKVMESRKPDVVSTQQYDLRSPSLTGLDSKNAIGGLSVPQSLMLRDR